MLAQLLILVYPAPYFLLVFLRPLSPAEFRRVPWREQGGGDKVGAGAGGLRLANSDLLGRSIWLRVLVHEVCTQNMMSK